MRWYTLVEKKLTTSNLATSSRNIIVQKLSLSARKWLRTSFLQIYEKVIYRKSSRLRDTCSRKSRKKFKRPENSANWLFLKRNSQ